MKLLLHLCCGPCSLYVIDALRARLPEWEITGYFYNPNIHPYGEAVRREKGALAACREKGIPLLVRREYDIAFWKRFAGPQKERCGLCYQRRFEETARYAAAEGFDAFSSTLFVSPYQDHEAMRLRAAQAAEKYGTLFLPDSDFREGFREGQAQARALGLYRQNYCGCICSLKEAY